MENQINQLKRDLSVHEGILYCYKDDAPIVFIDNNEDPSKLAKACYDAGYNAALKEVLRLGGGHQTIKPWPVETI